MCRVTFLFADLTKNPLLPWRGNTPRLLGTASFRTARLVLTWRLSLLRRLWGRRAWRARVLHVRRHVGLRSIRWLVHRRRHIWDVLLIGRSRLIWRIWRVGILWWRRHIWGRLWRRARWHRWGWWRAPWSGIDRGHKSA
jgi:hypothetical protein